VTESLDLVIAGGVLVSAGTALLMARPLTRIVLGTVLLGNGVNLLLLSSSGAAGEAPLLYAAARHRHIPDPLPQAFVLTAIVITLALTSFLVTMAYRAWQLSGTDDVQDDVEDIRVARRAEHLEERGRLPAHHRERRFGGRRFTGAESGTGAADETGTVRETGTGDETGTAAGAVPGAYRYRYRDRDRHLRLARRYREARRRARAEARAELRAEIRADRARQARAEEEPTGEDDPWETVLGGDR
jgi:multicomponent Na+:H+ antiporter subunit C